MRDRFNRIGNAARMLAYEVGSIPHFLTLCAIVLVLLALVLGQTARATPVPGSRGVSEALWILDCSMRIQDPSPQGAVHGCRERAMLLQVELEIEAR